jgi:hypothetical protein
MTVQRGACCLAVVLTMGLLVLGSFASADAHALPLHGERMHRMPQPENAAAVLTRPTVLSGTARRPCLQSSGATSCLLCMLFTRSSHRLTISEVLAAGPIAIKQPDVPDRSAWLLTVLLPASIE